MDNFSMNNEKIRFGVVFLLGLIVGLGIYWAFDSDNSASPEDVFMNEEVATTTQSLIKEENGLIVEDQDAGKTVKVAELIFKRPGWVAIHDNVNGTPGRILGARVFDIGTTTEAVVELLRGTVGGKSYFAMLQDDDGQYKQFNPHTDKPLLNEDRKPIMVLFQVTGNAETSATAPLNFSKE